MNSTARINKVVRAALPKGKPARILWLPTGVGKSKILRVITPAWKSLPRSERILRLQQAVETNVQRSDLIHLFRISVMTQDELRTLDPFRPARFRSGKRSRSAGIGRASF